MSTAILPCKLGQFANEIRFFLETNHLKQSDLVRSCSSVNKVSLSRILSGKRKPSPLEIEELLTLIKKPQKINLYQKEIHPHLDKFLSSKNEVTTQRRAMSKIEEKFYQDKHAHWILVKSQTKFGVKKSQIKKKFGDYGLTLLRRIEMADLIKETNGVYRYNRLRPTAGVDSILTQMKMNIDYFDESKAGHEQVAAINLLLETTQEGRKRIHQIIAKASQEIKAIASKNQPQTPLESEIVFTNILLGDYDS